MRTLSNKERKERVVALVSSLPSGGGIELLKLDFSKPLHFQTRACETCNKEFRPSEPSQAMARFCSRSCSAKWRMSIKKYKEACHTKEARAKRAKARGVWLRSGTEKAQAELERIRKLNPSCRDDVRRKISKRLREIGHKPSIRGGNGRGLTKPQKLLLESLGCDWSPEVAISLGGRIPGYPTNYKVDLGNKSQKIAIEVDGFSHASRRHLDAKKDAKLSQLGWTVIRVTNQQVMDWHRSDDKESTPLIEELSAQGVSMAASCRMNTTWQR